MSGRLYLSLFWLINLISLIESVPELTIEGNVNLNNVAITASYAVKTSSEFRDMQTRLCNSIRSALTANSDYNSIFQTCRVNAVVNALVTIKLLVDSRNGVTVVTYNEAVTRTAIANVIQNFLQANAATGYSFTAPPNVTYADVTAPDPGIELTISGPVNVNNLALTANNEYSVRTSPTFLNLQTGLCNAIRGALTIAAAYNSIYKSCFVNNVAAPNVQTKLFVESQNNNVTISYKDDSVLKAIAAVMPKTGQYAFSADPQITTASTANNKNPILPLILASIVMLILNVVPRMK